MPHFRVCSLRPCYQRLWLDMRLGFCVLGRVAETALNMVVDKPGCLEKRITDRRTEKPESPPFHVPAHGFRLRRNSGNLSQSAEMVNNGLMIGEKRQDVPVKTAEFFLNGHKQFRIIDSAVDFKRFLTIPSNRINRSTSSAVIRATFSTSKSWKALRYPSRFRRIVSQDNPAWALSSTRNSNRVLSSETGLPHSSSWYFM